MAITVDYTLTPHRITIPKSDLTLITGTQYSLDVDDYWDLLADYSDSQESLPHPLMYSRIKATSSTPSITEIDGTFYDLQFADGLYSVNIINGNTNMREVEVKNTVSVNTNNTTGFIDPTFLEFSTFDGGVWLDQAGSNTGTNYPSGTPASPVNNLIDAVSIAISRGFDTIHVKGDFTFLDSAVLNGYIMIGQGFNSTHMALSDLATITNCKFSDCDVNGFLDGGSELLNCRIQDLDYVDGLIKACHLNGTITLNGAQADFVDCVSGVAGGDDHPFIDMGGSGTNLTMRGWEGGIELTNHTTGTDSVSIDIASGSIFIADTVSSGEYTIRGVGDVINNSTGSANVKDMTVNKLLNIMQVLVDEMHKLEGLSVNNPMTVTKTNRTVGGINQDITGDGINTTTVTRNDPEEFLLVDELGNFVVDEFNNNIIGI